MKKIFLPFLLVFWFGHLSGQVKPIKHPMGHVLAFECSNGSIKNVNEQPDLLVHDTLGVVDTLVAEDLGEINTHSTLLMVMQDSITIGDAAGDALAFYNPILKELKDINNHLLFKLNETNQVLDADDGLVGWIDETGNVVGADANVLAEAPGIEPFKLAYLFFFIYK